MPVGYSSTPLVKKLGIKPGHTVAAINEPKGFRELLVDLPNDTTFQSELSGVPDIAIGFFSSRTDLGNRLSDLGEAAFPDRGIWLAWPKKTSGVETDLTGDIVRASVLATKLADIRVCAISETWSGLKIMWRKEHR